MADSRDWSDEDRPPTRGKPSGKKSGVPTWLRVVSPISNLSSLRKGGKVKRKSKRMKARA